MCKDIELLPCPFCGSRAQECYKDCGLYECSNNNCELNSCDFEAKEWNTRFSESDERSETRPQQEQSTGVEKISTLKDINEDSEEGKFLMMAIARLTCTVDSFRTPGSTMEAV